MTRKNVVDLNEMKLEDLDFLRTSDLKNSDDENAKELIAYYEKQFGFKI